MEERMGTLTGMMNIATHALDAQQAAINTTSKNVANQTTAGYTREVTSFSETDAVTLNGTSVGTGVTTSTTSQRDLVLESSLHLATQSASSASSRLDAPAP
jgi:flagellar hook-associated protein 1